ncbi:MAG: undecaprenyldiphospho-muramoylpentapeptide beta-N-acetylglucosaminyltransferase [Myxococcales bacterium]|nr:undecaprenyldiphospho-muramoylpentapeptide beta-N-acetylglucosaminyltransferase [Myxococcales bacterium]
MASLALTARNSARFVALDQRSSADDGITGRPGASALAMREEGREVAMKERTGAGPGRGLRVVIAGGGTGGHLFPGIALAEEIQREGGEVLFVGTDRGIEARVVPEQGYALAKIDASGIKGRGVLGLVRGLARLPGAWWQSRAILKRFRPDVVVGVGGYASGPLIATAAMMGIPGGIMEQNSVPGITNRILARVVKRIFCTFEDPKGFFPAQKCVLTGNPIRRQLLASLQGDEDTAAATPPRLFVFGGSQGARAINRTFLAALPTLLEALPDLEIWHQTGKADYDEVKAGYAALGLEAPKVRVDAFIKGMAEPYRWCDLVLCRAGATSLAELTAVGRPAVLVPFPHATDNHQEHNARSLVDAGAATLLRESEWSADTLAEHLRSLLGDRERLTTMSRSMLAAARPDAAGHIYSELVTLVGDRR